MKILLIDVDSKIPNLALMKISTYHKRLGDEVGFNISDPDKIYASIVFQKNKHAADGLHLMYPDAEIDIGGTGYDVLKALPHIDLLPPDYSLYPDCDYSLGFTSRGCIRNCPFCFVPKKEGRFKVVQHPSEWYDPSKKKITFLDNNILADKNWFLTVADWCIEKKLKVEFNQGIDIRLLDREIAEKLTQLKPIRDFNFAYDDTAYKKAVFSGIALLKEVGFNVRSKALFYVYVSGDEMYDDAVRRCRELKAAGAVPFIMVDPAGKITPRVRNLRRWGCRAWITMSCDIDDYKKY